MSEHTLRINNLKSILKDYYTNVSAEEEEISINLRRNAARTSVIGDEICSIFSYFMILML